MRSFIDYRKKIQDFLALPGHLHDLEHRQESRLQRMLELFHEKPRHHVVTLLVFGSREENGSVIAINSHQMILSPGQECTLQTQAHFPVSNFQMMVLADLSQIQLAGLFHGVELLGGLGDTPIAFGKDLLPGQYLRAIVRAR